MRSCKLAACQRGAKVIKSIEPDCRVSGACRLAREDSTVSLTATAFRRRKERVHQKKRPPEHRTAQSREETPKEGCNSARQCCNAIYIVRCTKCQYLRSAPYAPALTHKREWKKRFQRLKRRFDPAFLLAGYACFLQIQLAFHATTRLVGDKPLL